MTSQSQTRAAASFMLSVALKVFQSKLNPWTPLSKSASEQRGAKPCYLLQKLLLHQSQPFLPRTALTDPSSHKPHFPGPDTPQQWSREESTNTAALHPRISAKYSPSQHLGRTSKHSHLLRQKGSSVSKALQWHCPLLDCQWVFLLKTAILMKGEPSQ